jgi:hypothetical protein
MRALFEVGEEVILCSKSSPELNGEAVVLKVAEAGMAKFNCPHCGVDLSKRRVGGGSYYFYYLDVPSKHKTHGCCAPWAELALRKKHKGSDFSFDQIMSEIKSTEKIKA